MIPDRFRPVLDEISPLTERFAAAGHRLYLVGGIVRELLISDQRVDDDFDFTPAARPDVIKALLAGWADAVWTQGERFGTIGAKKDEPRSTRSPPTGPRRTTTTRASRDVEFADDIETDLSRRDFTVNAMALELTASTPKLVDPFGGAADLPTRTLRTPLSPEMSFSDDPLRMLRAARFIAGYHLQPVPELSAAVSAMHDRLQIVSAERIRDELDKLITVAHPRPGCGSWSTPASPTSSFPSCRRCDSNRTRSTGTRTCSPTRSR